MMLSIDELDASCNRCNLTSLLCEQGFHASLEDAKADNPDLDDRELLEEAMYRMLYENLDYGKYAELDGEEEMDDHPDRMLIRSDLCMAIAVHWVAGKYSNQKDTELVLAQQDLDVLLSKC